MRRFQSPLIKVHAVCEQQCQLAEMELSRAMSVQRLAELKVIEETAALDEARNQLASALRVPLMSSMLQGLHGHLAAAAQRLEMARTQVHEAALNVAGARDAWQVIHQKVESLTRLLDQHRAAYRQEQFKEQQGVMDDGSVFRWTGSDERRSDESW